MRNKGIIYTLDVALFALILVVFLITVFYLSYTTTNLHDPTNKAAMAYYFDEPLSTEEIEESVCIKVVRMYYDGGVKKEEGMYCE